MRGSPERESVAYGVAMGAASTVYRVFASIAFVILVTRKLTIDEFGMWGLIISIAETFTAIPELWNFWLSRAPRVRDVPREVAAWTAVKITTGFLAVASTIYLTWVYAAGSQGPYTPALVAGLGVIVVGSYWNYMVKAGEVEAPARLSKAFMIYETARLAAVVALVTLGDLRLLGAVLAVLLGRLASTVYMAFFLRVRPAGETMAGRALRESLQGSIVPVLNMASLLSYRAQRVAVYAVTLSKTAVAYLNLVMGILRPLLFFSRIGVSPVYSKTIADEAGASTTYRLAIPFTLLVLSATLAAPRGIASLFNPQYVDVWILFPLGALAGIVDTFLMIEYYTTMGHSRPDERGVSLPEVVRSGLRHAAQYRAAARLAPLAALLVLAEAGCRDPLVIAVSFVTAFISAEAVAYLVIRRYNTVMGYAEAVPYRELLASLAALAASQVPALLLGSNNIVVYSVLQDAPSLAAHLAVVAISYLAVLYILSPWYRALVKRALSKVVK